MCSVEGCEREILVQKHKLCKSHYAYLKRTGKIPTKPINAYHKTGGASECRMDGCNQGRYLKQTICKHHYREYMRRRYVAVERTGNHKTIKAEGHPLANSNGRIVAYRKKLYDEIGPGPHECFWGCGRILHWDKTWPKDKNALIVDHLDADRNNNSLDNLLPSCGVCNIDRIGLDSAELIEKYNLKKCNK